MGSTTDTAGAHDHAPRGIGRWLFSTNHKDIGTMYLVFAIVAGLIGGSAVASRAAERVRPGVLVGVGMTVMTCGAVLNVALNALPVPAVPWLVVPLAVYTFGLALLAPAVTLFALDLYPHRLGLAASVQAFVQTMAFALISSVLVPRLYGSGPAHAATMLALLTGAAAGWFTFLRTRGTRLRPNPG